MNVYDFDHTIYAGDCTVDFWIHCMKRYPATLKVLPRSVGYAALFKLGLCKRETFKEKFYSFLRYVPDVTSEVDLFWNLHIRRIKGFYQVQARSDDLVISASPEFLIDEACKRLGIRSIASKVDPTTGKLSGPNCRGEEKVRRFQMAFPDAQIEKFYSDSISDVFLAQESKEAFLIKKNTITKWSV